MRDAKDWKYYDPVTLMKGSLPKMIRKKERDRREKQDLMMSFLILKMISECMKNQLEEVATEKRRFGRLKFLDQALYEMATKRRANYMCDEEETGPRKQYLPRRLDLSTLPSGETINFEISNNNGKYTMVIKKK